MVNKFLKTMDLSLEQLMQVSVDISKNYIAILAFNFEVDVEHNFELDIV